ncbi:28573_t:CDS:1, partial [Racocetra persica]
CRKDDFKKIQDRDAYLNRKFLYKPSIIQNLIVTPIPLLQNSATDQILIQNYVLVDNLILLDDIFLSPIQNMPSNNLLQNDTEWFDNMEDKYNINTDKK